MIPLGQARAGEGLCVWAGGWHCRPDSCSLPATYLVRSIYAERLCDECPPCAATCLGDPELQGNGRRFTAETAVPRGGTVVPAVFLPATYLVRSIYAERLCDERRRAWQRASAILNYKETEGDSLPRRQCHRVALSSPTVFLPATYLVRSIYAERLCDERRRAWQRALGDPELQGNGRRFTAETAVPRGGTVVPTVFLPATHLVRSIYAERLCDERRPCVATCLGDPELQGNGRRFTAETAVPRGGTVVPTVFLLTTYLVRSIYAELWCEQGPAPQRRIACPCGPIREIPA